MEKQAGEALPSDTPLADRRNMVIGSTVITAGRATAVVTATGMDTEMGKIAGLLGGERESRTPLQEKLAGLGKSLGLLALAACAVILGDATDIKMTNAIKSAFHLIFFLCSKNFITFSLLVLSLLYKYLFAYLYVTMVLGKNYTVGE